MTTYFLRSNGIKAVFNVTGDSREPDNTDTETDGRSVEGEVTTTDNEQNTNFVGDTVSNATANHTAGVKSTICRLL